MTSSLTSPLIELVTRTLHFVIRTLKILTNTQKVAGEQKSLKNLNTKEQDEIKVL